MILAAAAIDRHIGRLGRVEEVERLEPQRHAGHQVERSAEIDGFAGSDEAQLAVAADEVLEIFAAVIVDRLQRHRADLVIGLRRQHMLRIARQAGGGDEARRYRFGHRIIFVRSEEHTSELQSLMRISYAVFCLKKKKEQTST